MIIRFVGLWWWSETGEKSEIDEFEEKIEKAFMIYLTKKVRRNNLWL
jgi:hypothetical protein